MPVPKRKKSAKPKSPVKVTKGFLSRTDADALFRALEAGPWDTLTVPQYSLIAKRKTVTYYGGDENAANKYMNKFGDKGIHAIPYAQAPAGLRALRERLRQKYSRELSLCYINYTKTPPPKSVGIGTGKRLNLQTRS